MFHPDLQSLARDEYEIAFVLDYRRIIVITLINFSDSQAGPNWAQALKAVIYPSS